MFIHFSRMKEAALDFKAASFLLLFICSSAVPIAIYYFLFDTAPLFTNESDAVFASSMLVKSRGTFFEVDPNPLLNPHIEEDFEIISWIQLSNEPNLDQDIVLFSKIDSSKPIPVGYYLKLVKRVNIFRPVVYWKDATGKGGTYEFSDLKISIGNWMSFVLTYSQPNILGLHLITLSADRKASRTLLGAFKLSTPVLPETTAPLVVGASRFGSFRGKVGPFGIFKGKEITKVLNNTLKQISKNPQNLTELYSKNQISFITLNGRKDVGPHKLSISLSDNLLKKTQS